MPDDRIPKDVLKYKPTICQDQGRPWKGGMSKVKTDFSLNLEVKKK
jgi:hypothetical protein